MFPFGAAGAYSRKGSTFSLGHRRREKEGGFGARRPIPCWGADLVVIFRVDQLTQSDSSSYPFLLALLFPLLCYAAIWVNIHF